MLAFDTLSARDVSAILTQARSLQRAARTGAEQVLLRNKNLALLCETDGDADALLFRRAATELGAHVALIRPSLSAFSTPKDVQHTARVLGRLYDAVECQGLPLSLVQQVGLAAGVPVYHAIASQHHPTASLGDQLEGSDASNDQASHQASDRRRFVLQAALLSSIG